RSIHLFVEVTNYAKRPMRLQRLDYAFGPSGEADAAHGQVSLSRTVEAGSAVVVEVPIDITPEALGDSHDLELRGNLITEQDSVARAPRTAASARSRRSTARPAARRRCSRSTTWSTARAAPAPPAPSATAW